MGTTEIWVCSVCVLVNGMCALSHSFSSSVWEASCERFHVVFSARVITTAEMLMTVWIRHGTRGHRGLDAVFDLLIPSAQRVLHTVFFKLRGGIGSEAKVHKWEACAFKWRDRNAECCKLSLSALSLAAYCSSWYNLLHGYLAQSEMNTEFMLSKTQQSPQCWINTCRVQFCQVLVKAHRLAFSWIVMTLKVNRFWKGTFSSRQGI